MEIYDITVNYLTNPVGIDIEKPEFSWKIKSNENNTVQTAYQIEFDNGWTSGKVDSDKSVFVEYYGEKLLPKTRYNFKITVWDNYNNSTEGLGYFETGLMTNKNFKGNWITNFDKNENLPTFRKDFILNGNVEKARIYATSIGCYEIILNGKKVGDNYLAPGFTPIHEDILYQTYDVTDMLKEENTICITVGKGWPLSRVSMGSYEITSLCALMDLDIWYENGETTCIFTDNNWKCFDSPFLKADIYDGEAYDANLYNEDYFKYGYDEEKLNRVVFFNYPRLQIHSQIHEFIRKDKEIKPLKLIITPKGEKVIDFGQNLTGWVKFKVKGNKNDKVVYNHGEILDKDGNFYFENMRSAKNLIEYTLCGNGIEEFEPHFTFQGFRYINLIEYPGEVDINNFVAYSIHTDYKKTGNFECSNPDINQLYKNVLWGQDDNFVDVPTDCPQRDERQGWTGDAQVFIKTAVINRNVGAFFRKWLKDVALEQRGDGLINMITPRCAGEWTSSAWGDATAIIPMEIYNAYGDITILKDQFDSIEKWISYIKNQGDNPYIWNTGNQFGDWLGLDAKEGSYEGSTDKHLIATAFFFYSTSIATKISKILGLDDKYKYYNELSKNISDAFKKEFLTENQTLKCNTQTAHCVVLQFGLTDNVKEVADNLAKLVKDNGTKLTTGFVGTPYLAFVLSENGYVDLAYDLVLQKEYPSWLYSVSKGATTIWEHWDGVKPDGSFWSKDMNSYNHYAYGSIAAWFFTNICGIKYEKPGYKEFSIKPMVNKKLQYAKAEIETMYGKIKSEWKIEKEKVLFNITVPANTKCIFKYKDFDKTLLSGNYEINLDY